MTFSGFLLIILNYFVLTYFDLHFYASTDAVPYYPPIMPWVWLMCSINNFIAHTLDGCDGKQARRTGSSTPLGELFDHGLDSWVVSFLPVIMMSPFGRGIWGGDALLFVYLTMSCCVTFFMSHWEKYLTGVLFLPWGYDISQYTLSIFFVYLYFNGYKSIKFRVPYLEMTFADVSVLLMLGGCFALSLPMSIWNIYRSYVDKTGKMRSFSEAIRPGVSAITFFAMILLWSHLSPSGIVDKQPRLMMWVIGTGFSNICCYLIVNQMSNTRSILFHWILVPLVIMVPLVIFTPLAVYELHALLGYAIFVTMAHVHYGVTVVYQLSEKFNIHVFSLEKPNPYGPHFQMNGTKKKKVPQQPKT
ncbi:ethanolaminephosphotransferase 1-like isoform X2 [Tubulanus polymorphus]